MLTSIDDGLWTADAPHRFFGLHLGTRMTVVKLRDGGLLLHSPVAMMVGITGSPGFLNKGRG